MAVKWIGTGSGLNVTPDFATIDLWNAYLNALGGFTEDEIGRVLWASAANELLTDGDTIDGSAPGVFQIILEAGDADGNAGGSFRDHADKLTNPLHYDASKGAAILHNSFGAQSNSLNLIDANTTVRYLQVKKTANYASVVLTSFSTENVLDSCIFEMDTSGPQGPVIMIGSTDVTNCLVLLRDGCDTSNEVLLDWGFAGTNSILNTTIVCTDGAGTRSGLRKVYNGTSTYKNIAIYGVDTDYEGNTANAICTNCATDKSSGTSTLPGTDHQYDLIGADEWESVTQDSEDFRLKNTSVKLRDNGTATGTPPLDIVEQARSGNHDIGAWEFFQGTIVEAIGLAEAFGVALGKGRSNIMGGGGPIFTHIIGRRRRREGNWILRKQRLRRQRRK